MRSTALLLALALPLTLTLAAADVLSARDAAADDDPVSVRRAVFRVPKVARRQAIALDLRFDGFVVAPGYDLETDGLTLTVAGVELLSLPAESGRVRARGTERFVYRMRAKRQRMMLGLDTGFGILRLRMAGIDVSGLAAADPDEAPVTLTLGDQVFQSSVSFRSRGATWAFRAPRAVQAPAPIPVPPPSGTANLTRVATGDMASVTQPQDVVATNQSELDALWALLGQTAPAKPTVDFQQDVVVASFIGLRPSSGYGVTFLNAELQSTGDVVVKRSSFKPGLKCVVATVITSPWAIATVTKPTGSVRFEAGVPVTEAPCP